MYNGRCEDVLEKLARRRRKTKPRLLFTSPPFPLNRKKRYGNLCGEDYLKWFASLAPLFREAVAENGSIVIELGNAWEPGHPTMSQCGQSTRT